MGSKNRFCKGRRGSWQDDLCLFTRSKTGHRNAKTRVCGLSCLQGSGTISGYGKCIAFCTIRKGLQKKGRGRRVHTENIRGSSFAQGPCRSVTLLQYPILALHSLSAHLLTQACLRIFPLLISQLRPLLPVSHRQDLPRHHLSVFLS